MLLVCELGTQQQLPTLQTAKARTRPRLATRWRGPRVAPQNRPARASAFPGPSEENDRTHPAGTREENDGAPTLDSHCAALDSDGTDRRLWRGERGTPRKEPIRHQGSASLCADCFILRTVPADRRRSSLAPRSSEGGGAPSPPQDPPTPGARMPSDEIGKIRAMKSMKSER